MATCPNCCDAQNSRLSPVIATRISDGSRVRNVLVDRVCLDRTCAAWTFLMVVRNQTKPVTRMVKPHTTRNLFTNALLCAGLLMASMAPGALASDGNTDCEQEGKNTQCNALGSIAMETQTEILGEPILVHITTTVDDTHSQQGARYIMFSIRHDATDSPVSLSLVSFETGKGEIFTERIDHPIPNEINVWVQVADIPEGKPIDIAVEVGSSDRGAFRLETLVMAFDRGYEPVSGTDGNEVTLFSFTMLGVNKESSNVASGSGTTLIDRVRVPGPGLPLTLLGVVAAGLWASRRRA